MKKIILEKGFTLVELLIVIALISILSVAVLATINPIEQSNKARDAQWKNDSAEVLSAYERYYASLNRYPWGEPSLVGETIFDSTTNEFGVASGVGASGGLIVTSELKSSFSAKEPFVSNALAINKMYVYNDGADVNYVCYVPKAKANRTRVGDLRCLKAKELLMPGDSGCDTVAADDSSWSSAGQEYYCDGSNCTTASAFFMCVPETATVAGAGTPTPTTVPGP